MATIDHLIVSLGPILNLHVSTLTRHASQLRVANLLPGEDEPLTALEVATFLAAVTGARAPTEAVEAARVFASLPLIGFEEGFENPATGAMGGTRLGICDRTPLLDEQAPLWAAARRSFVAALEVFIHLAEAPDRKPEELPIEIRIMRNLQCPVALIALGRAEADGVWHEVRLFFGSSDAASRAGSASAQRLQVWAYLPAIVIPLLGDLLADRLDVTAVRPVATPAEEELSRTGPYIADKLGPVTAILKMMPDWIPLAKEAGKMMAEHSKELATEAALERSLNPDTAAEIARKAQEARAQDITNRLLKFGGGAKRSRP